MDVNPLTLFPKGLWEMMLANVLGENPAEGSKDVLSFMRAYPVMEMEFPALKEHCLILQVLSILEKKNYFNFKEEQFLKCRLYNKGWCRAVDAYLSSQTTEEVIEYFSNDYPDRSTFQQRGDRSVARFMKALEDHPASRNPFICNKRVVDIKAAPALPIMEGNGEGANAQDWQLEALAQERYMADIMKMLEKYGKHIWNFIFEFDSSFFDVQRQPLLWANFEKMLQLLPNLKYFNLRNTTENYSASPTLRKSEENALRPYLESPLPDLPRLEELTVAFSAFGTCRTEANLWTQCVHRYATQLTDLKLIPQGFRKNDGAVFKFVEMSPFCISFPELRALVYYDEDDYTIESLSYLMDQVLNISAPKLEIIELRLNYTYLDNDDDPELEWKGLLKKLKKFPLLKRFKIGFYFLGVKDLSVEEDSLLTLTDFSMHHDESYSSSFKMLLCFPNLEHLKIKMFSVEDTAFYNSQEIIYEEVQSSRFFKNNIWELLPNLKTICFSSEEVDLEYRREEYEKLKQTGIDGLDDRSRFACSLFKYISDSLGAVRHVNKSGYQTDVGDFDMDISGSDLNSIVSDSDNGSFIDEDANGCCCNECGTDSDEDGVNYGYINGISDSDSDGISENDSDTDIINIIHGRIIYGSSGSDDGSSTFSDRGNTGFSESESLTDSDNDGVRDSDSDSDENGKDENVDD